MQFRFWQIPMYQSTCFSMCTWKQKKNSFSWLLLGRRRKNTLRLGGSVKSQEPHLAFGRNLVSVTLNHGQFCPQGTFSNVQRHQGSHNLGRGEEVWLAPRGQRLGVLLNSLPCTGQSSTTKEYPAQMWGGQGLRSPARGETALFPSQEAALLQWRQQSPWHGALSSLETYKI